MPYLATSQEWLTQSALLLQARPSSARITTKYTLSRPSTSQKSQKRRAAAASTTTTPPTPATPAPKAVLTLKTYDPISGTTLKYQTDKAQEVGRLVLALERLGRAMAGLEEIKETEGEGDRMEGVEVERDGGVATPPVEKQAVQQAPAAKKGKKKGKK